jgi:NADPH:quinone reductase-like Zn-dependent oxidoreductase
VLKRGGVLVTTLQPPAPEEAARHGVRATGVWAQTNVRHLQELATLIDSQQLRPAVSRILPLAQAKKAHELSEAGHVRGKIVLDVIG